MSKRSVVRNLVAVSLSLAFLFLAAAPARAMVINPGDAGLSLWSTFAELVAQWLGVEGVEKVTSSSTSSGTGTTTNGSGGGNVCAPGTPNCGSDQGPAADPLGRP